MHTNQKPLRKLDGYMNVQAFLPKTNKVSPDQSLGDDDILPLTSLVTQPYPTHSMDAAIIPAKYGL